MAYDTNAFTRALTRYHENAKTLTEDDLSQLAIVDVQLAARARGKRAGLAVDVGADETPVEKRLLKLPVSHRGLMTVLKDYVWPILGTYRVRHDETNARIDALEQQVKALQGGGLKYLGVWKDTERYAPGHFVTHHGSLWHCNRVNISTRPGSGDGAWTLAVKRGQDGKSA